MARKANTPLEWVEAFRVEAVRDRAPLSPAAGGRCWLAHDGMLGVSIAHTGYAHLRVTWPGGEGRASSTDLAHRVTLASAVNAGRPLRSELDGATMQVHHLCKRKACVRPDHLEYLDGIENRAEMVARQSVLRSTQAMVGELEAAHHDELGRRRWLQRELGRAHDERDLALAELARLRATGLAT